MVKKEPIAWITMHGAHVPIYDGESKDIAIKRYLNKIADDNAKLKEKQIQENKKRADELNNTDDSIGLRLFKKAELSKDEAREWGKLEEDSTHSGWNADEKLKYSKQGFMDAFRFYSKYQLGSANKDNFFNDTIGVFRKVDTPNRKPDYVSKSGSRYWYTKDGVYRQSNHWGQNIASCDWALDDYYGNSYDFNQPLTYTTGFIKWEDLKYKTHTSVVNPTDSYDKFRYKFNTFRSV